MTSHLWNRSHFVKIGSQPSTLTQLDSVVTQGSVLGLLLFLIHLACWRSLSGVAAVWIIINTSMIRSSTTLSAQGTSHWYESHWNLHARYAGMVSQQLPSAEPSKIWGHRSGHHSTMTVHHERFQDQRCQITAIPHRQSQVTGRLHRLKFGWNELYIDVAHSLLFGLRITSQFAGASKRYSNDQFGISLKFPFLPDRQDCVKYRFSFTSRLVMLYYDGAWRRPIYVEILQTMIGCIWTK